jgi:hypothetical protein
MAKVEVQIRHCLCCGLHIGSVFVALYTLFLYALLTGLAIWALSDAANGNDSMYNSCELGKFHYANFSRTKKFDISVNGIFVFLNYCLLVVFRSAGQNFCRLVEFLIFVIICFGDYNYLI